MNVRIVCYGETPNQPSGDEVTRKALVWLDGGELRSVSGVYPNLLQPPSVGTKTSFQPSAHKHTIRSSWRDHVPGLLDG